MESSRATGPCGYRSRCDFDNQRRGLGGVPPEPERSRGRYDSQAPRAGDVVPKASRNGTGSNAPDLAQGDAVRRRCATRVPPRGLLPLGAGVVYLPTRPATTRELRRPVVDGGSSSRVPGEKSIVDEPEQKVRLIHGPHLRSRCGSLPSCRSGFDPCPRVLSPRSHPTNIRACRYRDSLDSGSRDDRSTATRYRPKASSISWREASLISGMIVYTAAQVSQRGCRVGCDEQRRAHEPLVT